MDSEDAAELEAEVLRPQVASRSGGCLRLGQVPAASPASNLNFISGLDPPPPQVSSAAAGSLGLGGRFIIAGAGPGPDSEEIAVPVTTQTASEILDTTTQIRAE